jgi:hypothetical protein
MVQGEKEKALQDLKVSQPVSIKLTPESKYASIKDLSSPVKVKTYKSMKKLLFKDDPDAPKPFLSDPNW